MSAPQPHLSIRQGFVIALVIILVQLPVGMLSKIITTGFNINALKHYSLISLVEYIVMGIVAIAFAYSYRKHRGITGNIGFNSFPPVLLVIGFLTIFSLDVISEPISNLIPMPEWFEDIMEKEFSSENVYTFISLVIAAPVIEELLLRGIILNGFLKTYHPWKAIVWSAILFAFIHLNPWQGISAFLGGLVLGLLYWKTRSIWLCILLHAIGNCVVYILILQLPEEQNSQSLYEYLGPTTYAMVYTIALVVLAGCSYYLYRRLIKHDNKSIEKY